MCKIGDIILIEKFKNEHGKDVGMHPFIVLSTKKGVIESMPLDMIAVLLSSIKDEKNRKRNLSYEVNYEVKKEAGLKKDSFVKGNQVYCFDSNKSDYRRVGSIDVDIFMEIREHVKMMLLQGKAQIITTNLELEDDSKELENEMSL